MSFKGSIKRTSQKGEDGVASSENIQCTLLGDRRVGKTSLLLSYQTDTFSSEYIETSWDNYTKQINYKDQQINLSLSDIGNFTNHLVINQQYDGKQKLDKEEHHGFINKFLGTDVFLLCFSIDDPKSFENIAGKWVQQIVSYYISSSDDVVDSPSSPKTSSNIDSWLPIILLVGCKSDRRTQKSLLEQIESQRQQKPADEDEQDHANFLAKTRSFVTSKEAIRISRFMRAYSYMECSSRLGTGIKEIFDLSIKAVLERRDYTAIQR